ncbi:uncharacterized protein L3040_001996 [Drepanopeziza brunnea f. sp. 'multigermtubi']|uniref:endo-1,3(4)-beta-glucanase n=1 Tax=Marssonina brunnea f. sp. multigermtubi (strain MB_m1) TaxID=1072389 RepID=K1Y3E8_MARBU|nr:uncharacterized protein MBM_01611 [Drepanopeziza brunnea f. sp. 'multigermtubi' MB_m1]EKD19659.1 hypothetical protein MBM_01611 [Drepanopeziza brunnea f. sp. 'multigermtubi' MB_m1]KAJ5052239.1 hypothetical protein L3040_001996 [Drepanopeziza brunnea f. sp. 'multigermtubi']
MALISSIVCRSYLTYSLFTISIWLLIPGALAIVSSTYQLDTDYSGPKFFEGFDFWTEPDPTNGFVSYQSYASSLRKGLVKNNYDGSHYMGVDHTTTLSTASVGRESVRISSKKLFTHGLFIADIQHMPGSICGSWPAFWMFGPQWPNSGEIDIIEGVNSQMKNIMTLHTGDTCTISGALSLGTLQTGDCNQKNGFGCGISSSSSSSYGDGFNNVGGGVYATQWTSDYIRIWFFPRNTIPADVLSGNPDPSSWGYPDADFQGNCDIDANFRNHQIVFDTTFCGDWAGGVFSSDNSCKYKANSCVDYVAGNPGDFKDSYWNINSVKVYVLAPAQAPAPPSSSTKPITTSKLTLSQNAIIEPTTTETSSMPLWTIEPTSESVSSTRKRLPTSDQTTAAFPSQPTSYTNTTIISAPPAFKDWKYKGCFSSVKSGFPTFTLASEDRYMTTSICAGICGTKSYFGIFSTNCYCGTQLTDTVRVADSACSTPCPGDSRERCGGLLSLEDKRSIDHASSGEVLGKRINDNYLLVVYEKDALPLDILSSSESPAPKPTADPSEAYFEPTSGGLLVPSITRSAIGSLIGLPMGESADPSDLATSRGTQVYPVHTITPLATPTTSFTSVGSLTGAGMGDGKGNGATTYTTVLTTTYTDVCDCAESTFKEFTVTSTMTLTHCGCTSKPSQASIPAQIPMTTMTRLCYDCGMSGTVIVTVPCTEVKTPLPKPTHPGLPTISSPVVAPTPRTESTAHIPKPTPPAKHTVLSIVRSKVVVTVPCTEPTALLPKKAQPVKQNGPLEVKPRALVGENTTAAAVSSVTTSPLPVYPSESAPIWQAASNGTLLSSVGVGGKSARWGLALFMGLGALILMFG